MVHSLILMPFIELVFPLNLILHWFEGNDVIEEGRTINKIKFYSAWSVGLPFEAEQMLFSGGCQHGKKQGSVSLPHEYGTIAPSVSGNALAVVLSLCPTGSNQSSAASSSIQ